MLKTRTYRVCTTARFARRAFLGSKAPHGAATVAVPAREGPLLVTLLRNLFADCTKSDGDSGVARARGAGLRAHAQGRRPLAPPRGGGLNICPPAGGRIAVEGRPLAARATARACRPSSRRRAAARRRRRAAARCRARCRRRPGRARSLAQAATTTRPAVAGQAGSPRRARRRSPRGGSPVGPRALAGPRHQPHGLARASRRGHRPGAARPAARGFDRPVLGVDAGHRARAPERRALARCVAGRPPADDDGWPADALSELQRGRARPWVLLGGW